MLRTLPLMHELERRARARGFSWQQLAKEIGVDRSTLAHIRSGRDRLSLGALHHIAVAFPTDATVQRLVWDYLLLDVETPKERREREAARSTGAASFARMLTESSIAVLRGFVVDLPQHALSGAGMLLTASTPGVLAAALGYLETELRARGIHALRYASNDAVRSSVLATMLGVPVLLVDRVEHASDAMREVLQRRAEYRKVTVATSVVPAGVSGPALSGLARSLPCVTLEAAPTLG